MRTWPRRRVVVCWCASAVASCAGVIILRSTSTSPSALTAHAAAIRAVAGIGSGRGAGTLSRIAIGEPGNRNHEYGSPFRYHVPCPVELDGKLAIWGAYQNQCVSKMSTEVYSCVH